MKGAILFRAGDELKTAVNEAASRAQVTQDAFMRAAVVAMVKRVQRTGRIGKENDQSGKTPLARDSFYNEKL